MFPAWIWTDDDDDDSSSVESVDTARVAAGADDDDDVWWCPPSDEIPGTFAYFSAWKDSLETRLRFPDDDDDDKALPAIWRETLEASRAAHDTLVRTDRVLEDMKKTERPQEQIDQAQKTVNQAQNALDECNATVRVVARSLLTGDAVRRHDDDDDDASPSIADFVSPAFDDTVWVTYIVLSDPRQWADYCCPGADRHQRQEEQPDVTRLTRALRFLRDVDAQRHVLAGGGPRGGRFGGYLDLCTALISTSAAVMTGKEPVLRRLAEAVALEFAAGDHTYFDTDVPVDPSARYLSYEQAYLMGDLDPAFATFSIWELRLAVNSPQQEWELAWGRECLQTYRPDWALTDDPQWRYCRLVRLDVGYMHPTWTSRPITMDQILSGGGECGPRAWFGRFMCQAFGIPIWGVRQVGHAAMSRWTERGWMVCLGAGFEYAWWEDQYGFQCGLDFLLETRVRAALPTPLAYLQRVLPLEWLADYHGESNQFILRECTYFDPDSPWYSLSLAHRQLLAADNNETKPHYPRSERTVPKILRLQSDTPQTPGRVRVRVNGDITIPADATTSKPSDKILIMPSFTGGRQVFLGKDATLQFALREHWLAPVTRTYRLTVQVATAHRNDTGLLLKIIPKNTRQQHMIQQKQQEDETVYRLPLPYTTALWQETQSIEISLDSKSSGAITLQREWTELYGISIKEIRLEPC